MHVCAYMVYTVPVSSGRTDLVPVLQVSNFKNELIHILEEHESMNDSELKEWISSPFYQRRGTVSKVTLDNVRRILSTFFSWLEDEDYIVKSPVRRIHKVKTGKTVKETYTDESLELMRDYCDNPRDLAMIDLLASTGIRVGELVKLNRADVDFENRECIVFGKGNKERKVYFDARTKIHLQKYLASRTDDNEALFVSLIKPFDRLQISGVEIRLRKIGRDLGIHKTHPHKFRRTLATIKDGKEDQQTIKNRVASGEYKKVQVCAIIGNPDYKEQYGNRCLDKDSFAELIEFIHVFNSDNSESDVLDFIKIGYRRNLGETITFKNYVGLIQMKNKCQIQILPKIEFINGETDETKKVFMKMLRCMKDFPSKVFANANLKIDRMNLYEVFINMYLQQVWTLVKHGIKSSYIRQEDNLTVFKGKLIVNEHIKANLAHKERFYVGFDEYLVNRPENRLIKTTLLKLLSMSNSAENVKEIRQLLMSFELVEPSMSYDIPKQMILMVIEAMDDIQNGRIDISEYEKHSPILPS